MRSTVFEGSDLLWIDEMWLNHFEKAPNEEDGIVSNCKECKLSEKTVIPVPAFSGNTFSDVHLWFMLALDCEYKKHLHKPSKKAPKGAQNSAQNNVCNMLKERDTLQSEAAVKSGKKAAEEAQFLSREKEKIECSEEELKNRKLKSLVWDYYEFESESESESLEPEYESESEYEESKFLSAFGLDPAFGTGLEQDDGVCTIKSL